MSNEENPLLREGLLDLWRDLEALEGAYRGSKISFYQPIGQQPEFHSADRSSVRLVLGSNRSGKSVAGVVEAIANSLGYRPWLAEDHPDRIVRLTNGEPIPVPNVGRVIAQNFEQAVVQTIWPKFEEWAPKGQYKIKRDNRGIPKQIIWKNNSKVHFMSNDQDDMAFEGTNGHWVWADEPIDYSKYIGLKRGLIDFSGHMWMTMTPLSQPWIADVIANRANDPDGNVKLFKFSIWDNCQENGGHLRREDIEEFLSDLREEELEARLHGNFLHLAGRVYKEWEPESPYWVPAFDIPDAWPRVCVIDPHPRKPIAVLWAAVNPDGQWFVYRNLFDNRLKTVSDVAARVKELEGWTCGEDGAWHRGGGAEQVCLRIIDSSANEQERTSGD
ncbi:MAG: terminase large subunit domain-containing protein, partial [Planctomycetota bacterium]